MPPSVNEGENAVDLDDDGDTSRDAVNDHPHPSRQAASSLHVDSDDIDSEDDAMANPTTAEYMTDEHHDPSFTPARFPAKRALNELLGGKKTCMVTGWEQASVVMHVLLRTSGFEELTLYEYLFGFRFLGFHVDSRKNTFYAQGLWRRTFDDGQWILLPLSSLMKDTVSFLDDNARRRKYGGMVKTIRQKWHLKPTRRFSFIPLGFTAFKCKDRIPIAAVDEDDEMDAPVFHVYPYTTRSTLELNVCPAFAVLSAALQYQKFTKTNSSIDIVKTCYSDTTSAEHLDLRERMGLLHRITNSLDGWKVRAMEWAEKERSKLEETNIGGAPGAPPPDGDGSGDQPDPDDKHSQDPKTGQKRARRESTRLKQAQAQSSIGKTTTRAAKRAKLSCRERCEEVKTHMFLTFGNVNAFELQQRKNHKGSYLDGVSD